MIKIAEAPSVLAYKLLIRKQGKRKGEGAGKQHCLTTRNEEKLVLRDFTIRSFL